MDIRNLNAPYNVDGFTWFATFIQDGNRLIYHTNPHIQERIWYDWAYTHFEQERHAVESYYLAKILGFVRFEKTTEAVIQCTKEPEQWSTVKSEFLVKVSLETNNAISTVTVPLSSLVHPLCVIPDYGGNGKSYLVLLPRRIWSRYYGDRINLS